MPPVSEIRCAWSLFDEYFFQALETLAFEIYTSAKKSNGGEWTERYGTFSKKGQCFIKTGIPILGNPCMFTS